jgi:hypothetical protein
LAPKVELKEGDFAGTKLMNSAARVAPARLVENEEGTRFGFEDGSEIRPTGPIDIAVVGEMPAWFPPSVQVLDLLRANVTKLTSVTGLRFLCRLIVPAVLECVGCRGVSRCPRLTEVVIGAAPLRKLESGGFENDLSLSQFPLPSSLEDMEEAFWATSISILDAGACGLLRCFRLWSPVYFRELILPGRFSGELEIMWTKSIEKATFGSVLLETFPAPVVCEMRFTALAPPRWERGSEPTAEMFAKALVFSETAQLLAREAAPARPP